MDLITWTEFERTGRVTLGLIQGLIEHNETEEKRRYDRELADFADCCEFCDREINRVPWPWGD